MSSFLKILQVDIEEVEKNLERFMVENDLQVTSDTMTDNRSKTLPI